MCDTRLDHETTLDYFTRLNDRLATEREAIRNPPPPAQPLTEDEVTAALDTLMAQWEASLTPEKLARIGQRLQTFLTSDLHDADAVDTTDA